MAPSAPRPSVSASPSLIETFQADFRHVAGEVQRRGVRRTVQGTFDSIEAFYLTDDERTRLEKMQPLQRLLWRTAWLFKGLLLKLTPARRIMLAWALLALLLATQVGSVKPLRITVRYPIVGCLLLLVILFLELKDKLLARDELEAGRKVQLALMPTDSPKVAGWDVWLYTQPANDVGGDLVDHMSLDATGHAVALGDVAGKALPAALLSVKLQATIRALAPNFNQLGDLGTGLNKILYRDGLPTRFASLVYLLLMPGSGHVRALNAGHMPPLVLRDGNVTTMDRGGMVLGIMPDTTFSEQSVDLNVGDVLVVYSDGVSEAMDEGGDFYGDDRLHLISRQAYGGSAQEIGTRVLDSVKTFIGHAKPSDDLSLMVLRRTAE